MQKSFTTILLLIFALPVFFVVNSRASDGSPVWTNVFATASNDGGNALVIGQSNIYITGYSSGGSDSDYITIKYTKSGEPLWTNRYNGDFDGDDKATALAIDSSENVYVTGCSLGKGSQMDIVTIKYSSDGFGLWTNRFDGSSKQDDCATSVAVNQQTGNITITGYSSSATGLDMLTLKYTSDGTALWTNRYNGLFNLSDDGSKKVVLDSLDNAYIAGWSSYDAVTLKYSNDGTLLWTNRFNGSENYIDEVNDLAIDEFGNVYIIGFTTSKETRGWDYLTIKYSPDGLPLWTNIFNGSVSGPDRGQAVATDRNGNAYVTGYYTSINGGLDWATIKYSFDGHPVWTNFLGSVTEDKPDAISVDPQGNVYVTGHSNGNALTVKYSTDGDLLWENSIPSAVPKSISVDAFGSVFVTGVLLHGLDIFTVQYSAPPYTPIKFLKTDNGMGYTNKQFFFTISAPTNMTAIVYASNDLLNWIPLITNTFSSNTFQFSDFRATNFHRRYYRAISK